MITKTNLSAIAFLLIAAPGLALAGSSHSNLPENVPYAIIQRCDTLKQRFDQAAANPKNPAGLSAARDAAAQGGALCRSGRYEEGGDNLARALQLIGESSR